MSHRPIPTEVFLTLLGIGWIDDTLDPAEADAILAAARAEGLAPDALARIEEGTRAKVDLRDIDASALDPEDRLYVYAVARWVTLADGVVTDREQAALDVLALVLGLTRAGREAMTAAVDSERGATDPARPGRLDLGALRARIAERAAAARR